MSSSPYTPEKQPTSSVKQQAPESPQLPDRERKDRHYSKYNPRGWTRTVQIIVGASIIAVILGAILGGVFGARATAYPDYYKIDYVLRDTYSGDSFFDQFNFFSGNDPTHGFVRYANAEVARSQNLVEKSTSTLPNLLSADGTIILRVDTSEQNATFGRRSVRISSKETYSSGLFIFDVIHSPYGCATWPALWISDLVSWPSGGEIDVMESVNVGDTGNHMALHTTKGCKVGKSRRRKQSGKALTYNCYNGTNANSGCGVGGPDYSYGQAFNEIGGGVYAVEVRSEGIRVWFFDRASIPMDIIAHAPDPSTWDTALADFPNLECNINKHFRDMAIVANIDLCGDWAGHPSVFGSNPMCKGTCSNYVAFIPDAFKEAYWEFSGFWVYEKI